MVDAVGWPRASRGRRIKPGIDREAPLFDYAASTQARDVVLKTVAENSGTFIQRALSALAHMSGPLTGEDIRRRLSERGIEPHHHNAWGALISTAVKRGILIDSGMTVRMKDERSHARKTTLYTVRRS